MAKLLIVDDDLDLIDMLSNYFLLKGYEIYTAYDGKEALDKMKYTPDLVILDVNMPKLNGIDVCKRIRDFTQSPILFLTARATEEDKVNGLLVGGDDYIVKPFSVRELEARIVSNLKREERSKYSHKMIYTGCMSIDLISMEVFINGQRLDLTKKEYERTVIFSTHVIEDIASTCNKLGIMQKGNLIFNGEISELLKNAENHVWNCLITNEKEILELSRYATISSKQYVNGNIMTKIISEEKPRIDCIRAEVTLEDAYLYMMKMYEINDVR